MSQIETVKVMREGVETTINKEDLQKGESVIGAKKKQEKKESKKTK